MNNQMPSKKVCFIDIRADSQYITQGHPLELHCIFYGAPVSPERNPWKTTRARERRTRINMINEIRQGKGIIATMMDAQGNGVQIAGLQSRRGREVLGPKPMVNSYGHSVANS